MDIMQLLATRRTYRRFDPKPVPADVIHDMVEAVRLSSCGANRQAVRLVIVARPEDVARVQPLVKWAAYLPAEQGVPAPGQQPTLFVAVVQDTTIPGDLDTDTGIALANLTLAAWAKGVGSCIMGAIDRPPPGTAAGSDRDRKTALDGGPGLPGPRQPCGPHDREHRHQVLPGREPGLLRAQAQRRGDRTVSVSAARLGCPVYVPSIRTRRPDGTFLTVDRPAWHRCRRSCTAYIRSFRSNFA